MLYKTLIVGNGNIGSALKKVLDKRGGENRKSGMIDILDNNYQEKVRDTKCKNLHICIPYSKGFIKNCLRYIEYFTPNLCVIHSSVPVGTTEKINNMSPNNTYIVHSPVRGQHPKLVESLKLFIKYVGTDDIGAYFATKREMSNIKTEWIKSSKTTELGKLLSTSYYGICISWHREMERFCKHFGVDFEDTVSNFNKSYNAGYKKLRPNVVRPVLTPPKGMIGGHCVVQNAKLLSKQLKSKFLKLIE